LFDTVQGKDNPNGARMISTAGRVNWIPSNYICMNNGVGDGSNSRYATFSPRKRPTLSEINQLPKPKAIKRRRLGVQAGQGSPSNSSLRKRGTHLVQSAGIEHDRGHQPELADHLNKRTHLRALSSLRALFSQMPRWRHQSKRERRQGAQKSENGETSCMNMNKRLRLVGRKKGNEKSSLRRRDVQRGQIGRTTGREKA